MEKTIRCIFPTLPKDVVLFRPPYCSSAIQAVIVVIGVLCFHSDNDVIGMLESQVFVVTVVFVSVFAFGVVVVIVVLSVFILPLFLLLPPPLPPPSTLSDFLFPATSVLLHPTVP